MIEANTESGTRIWFEPTGNDEFIRLCAMDRTGVLRLDEQLNGANANALIESMRDAMTNGEM